MLDVLSVTVGVVTVTSSVTLLLIKELRDRLEQRRLMQPVEQLATMFEISSESMEKEFKRNPIPKGIDERKLSVLQLTARVEDSLSSLELPVFSRRERATTMSPELITILTSWHPLRVLRNKIAHGEDVTYAELEYGIRLALAMQLALKKTHHTEGESENPDN